MPLLEHDLFTRSIPMHDGVFCGSEVDIFVILWVECSDEIDERFNRASSGSCRCVC